MALSNKIHFCMVKPYKYGRLGWIKDYLQAPVLPLAQVTPDRLRIHARFSLGIGLKQSSLPLTLMVFVLFQINKS
jgi:hypothetical protein